MDYLDSNLHSSILASLAANLASSSQQDDLTLLTDSFSSVEAVTKGVVNGLLARLAPENGVSGNHPITLQQAESISAFAEYCDLASPKASNLKRILAFLHALPGWELEVSLGLQNCQEWALSDQLTYRLVSSTLSQVAKGVGERHSALEALASFQSDILDAITTASGYRIIGHLLPALNGCRRAIASSAFRFDFADPAPPRVALDHPAIPVVAGAIAEGWEPTTPDGRLVLATLEQYSNSLRGFMAGFVPLVSIEVQRAYLLTAISGANDWDKLVASPPIPPLLARPDLDSGLQSALALYIGTLSILAEASEEGVPTDPYAFDILSQCLIVAALYCLTSGNLSPNFVEILDQLVGDNPLVEDEAVQISVLDCLQVLACGFPHFLPQATKLVRYFILSPSRTYERDAECTASPTLLAAATCYSKCLQLDRTPGVRESAIPSLLNSFVSPVAGEDAAEQVSINVVHVVSKLAQSLDVPAIQSLAVSMLLQRLSPSSSWQTGAILFELAELCQTVDFSIFSDIVKAFSVVSKRARADESLSQAVLAAQNRLAVVVGKRPDFHNTFILELLSLFVEKGTAEDIKTTTHNIRSQSLLELVPILDAFFSSANLDPHRVVDPREVPLFRSIWYLFVLCGFLSTPARIADWQRAALVRIAVATPCLVDYVSHDFVETELMFESVLRRSFYTLSAETVRSELAAAVPQQASHVRSISPPQAVLLMAILRVESLRAEAGYPSTILSYFQVERASDTAVPTILLAITDRINQVFISHFSDLVTRHCIDKTVFGEVRAILLECCHQYSQVRTVSIRYLNDLITSFPSLICEASVVAAILELLTVLRRACQAEFVDEYTPLYSFHSTRGDFTLVLPDDYEVRNSILVELHQRARTWLKIAVTRAPFEMQGLLQDYINGSSSSIEATNVDDEMGKSVAIDLVRAAPSHSRTSSLPSWGGWKADNSSQFARTFRARNYFGGEKAEESAEAIKIELHGATNHSTKGKLHLADLHSLLYRAAAVLVSSDIVDGVILERLVGLPFHFFAESTIILGQEVWTWVVDARPDLENQLMIDVSEHWARTIQKSQGFFSSALNRLNPLDEETKFTPTDKAAMTKESSAASRLLQPHSILLYFLSSRFQAFRYRSKELVLVCMLLIKRTTRASSIWSTHPLARELRMRVLSFGFCILQGTQLESSSEELFRASLYEAALLWFRLRPGWSYGSNRIQIKSDVQATEELRAAILDDQPSYTDVLSTLDSGSSILPGHITLPSAKALHSHRHHLLVALLDNELDRLRLWINPLSDPARGLVPTIRVMSETTLRQLARMAWACDPAVAIHMPERFKFPLVTSEVTRLVRAEPLKVQNIADALQFFIGETLTSDVRPHLRHLLYWAPVPVISALRFLFPKFGGDAVLLQYALRVLEHHPVEVTFFYIPQVVQALRTDALGYAERFIFETSKISQLFCHQIIWNMKANAYRGDAGEEADPMKPTLDRMVEMIVDSLSGEAKDFFQREFSFFDEVTAISAKLKPFIKNTKLEKKAKIDEEMAKIKVDPGVYLPSNPDGVVVDIDRLSGRPLQSHAKAPFMATFKVRRERKMGVGPDHESQNNLIELEEETDQSAHVAGFDTWQSAIFKVGDDCRQDVLALQIIAMHKNIFTSLGLDLLVTPYRVTATGPGCGVIDVIPNATSRDEMGRAKVNDLRSFFVMKYGTADGVHFQKARVNFIQSMAAYSLLCYIVQIKDRHNGNIMIDGQGCITHIDFGFLFDIGPGGVKFEPNSFKLSHEMVVLMGGRNSVGFRQFSELTVKAFLACRPYGQAVVDTSSLMMSAEFPSFKGEGTMQRLKERFRLDLSERDAAEYMKSVIANACENPRSIVYDEFQRVTNGIPYVR